MDLWIFVILKLKTKVEKKIIGADYSRKAADVSIGGSG